jgi:hypothetical protein
MTERMSAGIRVGDCTRCGKPVYQLIGTYCRTRRGPHHRDCDAAMGIEHKKLTGRALLPNVQAKP